MNTPLWSHNQKSLKPFLAEDDGASYLCRWPGHICQQGWCRLLPVGDQVSPYSNHHDLLPDYHAGLSQNHPAPTQTAEAHTLEPIVEVSTVFQSYSRWQKDQHECFCVLPVLSGWVHWWGGQRAGIGLADPSPWQHAPDWCRHLGTERKTLLIWIPLVCTCPCTFILQTLIQWIIKFWC